MIRPKRSEIGVVLFDLDGTLISSIPAVERCWADLVIKANLQLGDISELHGVPARQSITRLLGEGRSDEVEHWVEYLHEAECTDTDGILPLPYAVELLAGLSELEIPWGIVTSCTRRLAVARVGAAGLQIPELLVTADDVKIGKPDPEPFLLGAHLAGVSTERAIVVEDAPAGVTAGLAAGMRVITVETTHTKAELPGATWQVAGLPEVADLLLIGH